MKNKLLTFVLLCTLLLFGTISQAGAIWQSDTTADSTAYLPLITKPTEVAPVSQISLDLIVSGFTKPLGLTHAGDGRLFVTEQDGVIKIIENGAILSTPFLDINTIVESGGNEQGLLGLAFHPDYATNGRFFVNYINLDEDTVIAEYNVSGSDNNLADVASGQILLTIEQPFRNHNGGHLTFGPDGYLYISVGDGGSANDPFNHGQNPDTLLGAILRIDVDGASPYQSPASNPYVDDDDGRDEVWSIGWRNPWRFSFDRLTGDMFVGDVGQSEWEEISFQAEDSNGKENYGWPIFEGSNCYIGDCNTPNLTPPIAEYNHSNGSCSVTGGYIYRGKAYPELTGSYFFADYCSGILWRLFPNTDGSWEMAELLASGLLITSFGEDNDGELYLLDRVDGAVYQIKP